MLKSFTIGERTITIIPPETLNILKIMTNSNKKFDFEASLNELEKLVDALERGDLNLEQSLKDFERGINLTRSCQDALTQAQQKVQVLLEKDKQTSLEDFPVPPSSTETNS